MPALPATRPLSCLSCQGHLPTGSGSLPTRALHPRRCTSLLSIGGPQGEHLPGLGTGLALLGTRPHVWNSQACSKRCGWSEQCPRQWQHSSLHHTLTAHFRSLQVTRNRHRDPPAGSLLGLCSHQGRARIEPGALFSQQPGIWGLGGGRIDISVSVTNSWEKGPQFCRGGLSAGPTCPIVLGVTKGLRPWEGQQRPPLFWKNGRGPETDKRDPPPIPASLEASWWQDRACSMKGAPSSAARSEQSAVALPSASCHCRSCPSPTVSARGQDTGQARVGGASPKGTGVWEALVGRRPFQSQADVWSEQGRQTVSPRSHLRLGLGPPGAGSPPQLPPHRSD